MDAKDKVTIQILLKIAKLFGIFPTEKPSRFAYCYQILIFTLTLFWSAYSIYSTATNGLYTNETTMFVFIDLVSSSFMMIHGVVTQLVTLLCPSGWRKLYEDLEIGCCRTTTGRASIYLELCIVHTLLFSRVALLYWAWLPVVGLHILKNYTFRSVNEYYSLLSTMIMVHVNVIIKRKFQLMSEILKNSKCLRHVQKSYKQTTQLINTFNSVFGYQILFIVAHCIFVLLENLETALRYSANRILFWSAVYSFNVIVLHV